MTDMEKIKEVFANLKARIIPVPDNTPIEPSLLGTLSNDEFVHAFREYQELMMAVYGEIEGDPEKYGFALSPSEKFVYTFPHRFRLADFMFYMCFCGVFKDGKLTVDAAGFKEMMRKHKKINILVDLLTEYGFVFEGYTPESKSFTVSYLDNPNLMYVMHCDVAVRKETGAWGGNIEGVTSFSYRWVEEAASQKHEKAFLYRMDLSNDVYRELQYWLYEKAKGYGYYVNPREVDTPGVVYQKGKKSFLYVCDGDWHSKTGTYAKIIFRKGFTSHPDLVVALSERFPGVFEDTEAACDLCAAFRKEGAWPADHVCGAQLYYEFEGVQRKNCAHKSFFFRDPGPEDMPLLLEAFVLENDIKLPKKKA